MLPAPTLVTIVSNVPWAAPGAPTTNRHRMVDGLQAAAPETRIVYLNTKGWRPRGDHAPQTFRSGLHVGDLNNRFPYAHRSWGEVSRIGNLRASRSFLRELRGRVDVCITYDPLSYSLCRYLAPKLLVYDCVDLYEEQPQYSRLASRVALLWAEHRLVEAADLVIVTSQALADKFVRNVVKTHILPGAADLRMLALPLPPPPGSATRIIYVGGLDQYKVDLEPLYQYASETADASVTIVGTSDFARRDPHLGALEQLPNVSFHPQRTHAALWSLFQGMTAGVIAGSDSRYSSGSFPLKLWDYFAMGLPVVAWGTLSLKEYDPDVVYLDTPTAASVRETVDALALRCAPEARARRRAAAVNHNPEQRASQVLALLESAAK